MFFNWNKKRQYSISYRNDENGRFVVFQFWMKKEVILISCKKDPVSGAVVLPFYNPSEEHPSALYYDEISFVGDIQKMIHLLDGKEITEAVLFHACDAFITEYIRKEHRLIDIGIRRIAIEFVLLTDALIKAEAGRELTENEKLNQVRTLVDRAFCKFAKYLYITHYRLNGESLEPYLIKA